MGSSASKPTTAPSHVWQSETPVRFSQELVDSLQSNPESDSTRAKTLELHIQSRVAAELARLQAQAEKDLAEFTTKLSAEEPASKTAGDTLRELGRESVQKDVEGLRQKLAKRKAVVEMDEGVEKARNEVIKCLRGNDRRPLDCWKEVQAFRDEVGRVERGWVEKVVR